MKVKNKIILMFLVALLILMFLPSTVKASTIYNSEISYNENSWEDTIEVVAAGKYIENATIPSTINGKKVTKLSGFEDCTYLKKVTIPSTVKKIDWNCFKGCTALTSINIPNSVTEIESYAFSGCSSLESITISSGITQLYRVTFENCTSLKTINLPNTLTNISKECFLGCSSISSINIPSSVKTISWGAFENCTSLTSVTIPSSVTELTGNWYQEGIFAGCTNLRTANINAKATYIPEGMFYNCTNLSTINFKYSTYTRMDAMCFENCKSLSSIVLPDGIKNIGKMAFSNCSKLTNISIPDTVEEIGAGAFVNCSSMVSITLPCGVRKISGDYSADGYCFEGCTNLRTLYFTKSIQEIGNDAFRNLSASNITFYGYSGTAAKVYANQKGFRFVECTPVSSISLSGNTTVNSAETITVNKSISPSNAYNKNLKWTSSNTSIATVDSNGVVTGKNKGTVTITATSRDGTFISATRKITVNLGLPFNDVTGGAFYFPALKYMYTKGYITGTSKTTFSPNDNLSRAMLVTILWNMEGRPNINGVNKFSDVKNGAWYTSAIIWASNKGVVNGNKDGTFAPNNNITRQEVAVMLCNYAKYKGKNVSSNTSLSSFVDNNKVASWAKASVQWAIGNKVIGGANGGTKINPINNATRAEATTMIKNYIDNVR